MNETSTKSHVLIIEDQPEVLQALNKGLSEAGYIVDIASTGEEGLTLFLEKMPELVVLDLTLPGRDGIDILSILRKHSTIIPVLILTARDSIEDRVTGLDVGADDYLTKPFDFSELLARIRALLRRNTTVSTTSMEIDNLSINLITHQVKRGDETIILTPKEYQLLMLLMQNMHMPVSRKTIAKTLWNVDRVTPLDNVTDVHVMRLRKKIDSPQNKKLIHTRRGLGFVVTDIENHQ